VRAGRNKVAGILLEAEAVSAHRLAVVVGIGNNVMRPRREHGRTPAISLKALGLT